MPMIRWLGRLVTLGVKLVALGDYAANDAWDGVNRYHHFSPRYKAGQEIFVLPTLADFLLHDAPENFRIVGTFEVI